MTRTLRDAIVAGVTAMVVALLFMVGWPDASAQPARPARTFDGKPNLNGIWQAVNTANWNLLGHSAAPGVLPQMGAIGAVPAGLSVVEGNEIPYQPWAAEKQKENFKNRMTQDPEAKCYMGGAPRAMYMPYPFQIVQTPSAILMAFEFASASRRVFLDAKQDAPQDSWMGTSNGRWEGDTLVIDSFGFNGQAWLDRSGNFHSESLHVVERITPPVPITCSTRPRSRTRKSSCGRGRCRCRSIDGLIRGCSCSSSSVWNSRKRCCTATSAANNGGNPSRLAGVSHDIAMDATMFSLRWT